jgi:hypothetical protein
MTRKFRIDHPTAPRVMVICAATEASARETAAAQWGVCQDSITAKRIEEGL